MLIIHLLEELTLQVSIDMLRVHEVAITTSIAGSLVVLPALGLSEISHWRELSHDNFASIVSSMKALHGCSCLIFCHIFHIDVSNHMLIYVVCNDDLFEFTELGKLQKDFLIEIFKMADCLNEILLRNV